MNDQWAGTDFQTTPPNPVRVPNDLGQGAEIQGQVPLIREGAPVRSLAFTGRGITFVRNNNIPSDANTVRRRLAGIVPFLGLVRSFSFGSDAQSAVYAGLAHGNRNDIAGYTDESMGGDTLCYYTANQGLRGRLIMGNYAVGAWWTVPLNFLLPRPGLALKFHLWNSTGGDVGFSLNVEVLEVIPGI